MAAPECHARKFERYSVGTRESPNYSEQKMMQSALGFRQVLWRISSKKRMGGGGGGERRGAREEIRGKEAGQEKPQQKCS